MLCACLTSIWHVFSRIVKCVALKSRTERVFNGDVFENVEIILLLQRHPVNWSCGPLVSMRCELLLGERILGQFPPLCPCRVRNRFFLLIFESAPTFRCARMPKIFSGKNFDWAFTSPHPKILILLSRKLKGEHTNLFFQRSSHGTPGNSRGTLSIRVRDFKSGKAILFTKDVPGC
jgi:hypothetical protein